MLELDALGVVLFPDHLLNGGGVWKLSSNRLKLITFLWDFLMIHCLENEKGNQRDWTKKLDKKRSTVTGESGCDVCVLFRTCISGNPPW